MDRKRKRPAGRPPRSWGRARRAASKCLHGFGLLFALGCQDPITVTIDHVPAVLFEIEYSNYAFTPVWKGFYVDAMGVVWSYDRSDERPDPAGERHELTHDELMLKYSPRRERVRETPLTEIIGLFDMIPAAGRGRVTAPVTRCADAGVLSFRAFYFDMATQRYTPIVLRREGDVIQTNTSVEAGRIYTWLNALELVQHISGCEP